MRVIPYINSSAMPTMEMDVEEKDDEEDDKEEEEEEEEEDFMLLTDVLQYVA
jgi:hypothetical protein